MADAISIYNADGAVVDSIQLQESVKHVSGRTSIGKSGVYYKGVGATYHAHCVLDPEGYPDARPADVFYYGHVVSNKAWAGRFGIFSERLQPYFSDMIGSCGPKELSIVEKSKAVPVSCVEVLGVHAIESLPDQYYIALRYGSKREPWTATGITRKLHDTLLSLATSGWSFPWDKAAIRDINADGTVTDVADMFHSSDPVHVFGSIYAVIYSLLKVAPARFRTFINHLGFQYVDDRSVPTMAMALMEEAGMDTSFAFPARARDEWDIYYHLAANCLMTGRNCAGVENIHAGETVADQYRKRFFERMKPHDARRIQSFQAIARTTEDAA